MLLLSPQIGPIVVWHCVFDNIKPQVWLNFCFQLYFEVFKFIFATLLTMQNYITDVTFLQQG